jgi:hypothetical protein
MATEDAPKAYEDFLSQLRNSYDDSKVKVIWPFFIFLDKEPRINLGRDFWCNDEC